MDLFEQFVLREKIDRSLAHAEVCKAKLDAGLAQLAAHDDKMRELLKQGLYHAAELAKAGIGVTVQPDNGSEP